MRKYTFGMLAATGALAVSAGLTGAATASNALSAASPGDGRVGILGGCSWAWPCGEVGVLASVSEMVLGLVSGLGRCGSGRFGAPMGC